MIVTLDSFFPLFYFSVFSKFPMDSMDFLKLKNYFLTRFYMGNSESTNRNAIYTFIKGEM